MPTSVRVIRVVDNEYTVEAEVEVDDITELFEVLTKTPWGRKVAHLLNEMLPDIPEFIMPSSKEEAEAEEKRIKEYEEKLRNEGRNEILKRFNNRTPEQIENDTKKEIREKYIDYIRRKQNREKFPECYGTWYDLMEQYRETGFSGLRDISNMTIKCNSCKFKNRCRRIGSK